MLYRGDLRRKDAGAGPHVRICVPLVVAITEVAVEAGRLEEQDAVALVGAGMLSLLVFPLIATALVRTRRSE